MRIHESLALQIDKEPDSPIEEASSNVDLNGTNNTNNNNNQKHKSRKNEDLSEGRKSKLQREEAKESTMVESKVALKGESSAALSSSLSLEDHSLPAIDTKCYTSTSLSIAKEVRINLFCHFFAIFLSTLTIFVRYTTC